MQLVRELPVCVRDFESGCEVALCRVELPFAINGVYLEKVVRRGRQEQTVWSHRCEDVVAWFEAECVTQP